MLYNVNVSARWNEWVNHHFGAAGINISFYADTDNDGLVNVLEYYADQIARDGSKLNRRATYMNRTSPFPMPIQHVGLDPNDADSDGDLLIDGFEWFYGFDPKVQVSKV